MREVFSLWRTESEDDTLPGADEGCKRVLPIAASNLAARELAQIDKPSLALDFCIADSIAKAEKIVRKIDAQWPKERV